MRSPARFVVAVLLISSSLGLGGCDAPNYPIVGAPFCASDEPGAPYDYERKLVMLTRGSNESGAQSVSAAIGAAWSLGYTQSKELTTVIIECDEAPARMEQSWAETLDPGKPPRICPNQRVVFAGKLTPETSERAKALGYGGYMRLPPLDVKCKAGTLVQDDDRTLSQILAQFNESVQRYHHKHEKLPGTLEELQTGTLQPELPSDPWGNPLRFSTAGSAILLHSSGPDGKADTDDDVEVIKAAPGSTRSIVSFDVEGLTPTSDYRAFVKRKG